MHVLIESYEVQEVMLDLMLDIYIISQKAWEIMGKSNFVYSLIPMQLENQS